MLNNKILCIGNNTEETDYLARRLALQLGVQYNGLIDTNNNTYTTHGVYQTSIEDLSINGVSRIIGEFDTIEIFEQQDSADQEAYLQRLVLKRQLSSTDITYPTIGEQILYVGCSHTAGVGHATSTTVYPYHFSGYFNSNSLVLGNPGKGNFLFEELLNQYSLKDARVIIQFTDIFRVRYYDASGSLIEKQGGDFTKEEIENFTEEKLTKNFLEIANRIVIRLRDANAQFIFFRLTQQHSTDMLINYELSKYKEFCWMPNSFKDTADDNVHHGAKSHRVIADRLIARWNTLYAQN